MSNGPLRAGDLFNADILALLDRELEVDIETARPDGRHARTTIWVVVVDGDVLARSYRGAGAAWYRSALRAPDEVVLHAGDRAVPTRAMPASDPDSIARYDRGLHAKYAGDPSESAMVDPAIIETTLRFEPR